MGISIATRMPLACVRNLPPCGVPTFVSPHRGIRWNPVTIRPVVFLDLAAAESSSANWQESVFSQLLQLLTGGLLVRVFRKRRTSLALGASGSESSLRSHFSSWWRFTHPARATRTTRGPTASIMDRVYLRRPAHPAEHSAEFSDSTCAYLACKI